MTYRNLSLSFKENDFLDHALMHAVKDLILFANESDSEIFKDYVNDLFGISSLIKRFYPHRLSVLRDILSKEYPDFPYDQFFGKGGEADEK